MEVDMRRWILLAAAAGVLASAPAAVAYFAPNALPPTWHVHNGCVVAVPNCQALAVFPQIIPGYDPVNNPAECPDATDKAFLGGGQPSTSNSGIEANQPLREGVCMTSTTIIHLKSIPQDQPVPDGWSGSVGTPTVVNGITYVTYYRLTAGG
jgi:hypothetical protein